MRSVFACKFEKLFLLLAIGLVLAVSATGASRADEIGERQKYMKANSEQMKVLAPMFKGDVPFDAAKVVASAAIIQNDFANARLLFPAGSTSKDSAALDIIWTENAAFLAGFDKGESAAAAVAAAGQAGNETAFKTAFMELGGACKACHEKYRKPSN